MSQRRFISRFTPSRTNPEDLEKILVQRNELLDDAVARVRESATTGNKHHLLFVGPRGSGKTNLVSLIFHRIDQQADLRDRLRIAWLNEDETSTTFLDFLLRIYRALAKKYPAEFPLSSLGPLYELDPASAAHQISRLLISQLADRPLLLLVENLNELFSSLGEDGQKAWRAFLQEHPFFTIVATAQRLFDGVTRRTSPFFGFFQTEHLRPLSVPEAISLLEKIAALNQDNDLGAYLQSRVGRARVRALHHLTGGNHRVYVVLSEFITRDSIAQLVGPFESMIDELTPYYQERLRWLSPLQRRIVEHLCHHAQPTPVKDIAKSLFSSHQTVASQLKTLRGLGYVESHPRGRESLYELSEPLMRLCVEVKENQQRKPLRLIVDFLRVWYDADKLELHLSSLEEASPERIYVVHALELLRTQKISLRLQYLLADLEKSDPQANGADRLQCLRELVYERGDEGDWVGLTAELVMLEKWHDTLGVVLEARKSGAVISDKGRGLLAFFCGAAQMETEQMDAAFDELTMAISTVGGSPLTLQSALSLRSEVSFRLSKYDTAIEDATRLLDMPDPERELAITCLRFRARAFMRRERLEDAILDFSRMEKISNDNRVRYWAIAARGMLLFLLAKTKAALQVFTQVIDSPDVSSGMRASILTFRSCLHISESRSNLAFQDLERAFEVSVEDTTNDASPIGTMIRKIFHSAQNAAGWIPYVTEIVRLFSLYNSIHVLGYRIVRCLPDIAEANINDSGLDEWVSVWREVGAPHDAMTVPLRLLETGVAYLKTKDEGALLSLPKEERSIVRQALKLPPETENS